MNRGVGSERRGASDSLGFGPEALARPDHQYKVAEIGEAAACCLQLRSHLLLSCLIACR